MATKKARHPFFITWGSWEYWPWYVANLPVFGFVLWFGIRARNLFFFSAVNPAIETGGVLGESKINILNRIPEAVKPKTIFIKKGASLDSLNNLKKAAGIDFPCIAKPNVGERGFLVSKIEHEQQLEAYLNQSNFDFIIQEYVAAPLELSVLHYLPPGNNQGKTTSICKKEFLTVLGDGNSSIRELMQKNDRAILQLERLEVEKPDLLKSIPEKGCRVLLEPIGNHCKGTTFLSGNDQIDASLQKTFDRIMERMEGIHYGRFDLRCESWEALKNGEMKILEFNGIAAEPAHIYDPGIPVIEKYRVIYRHWKIIFQLYKKQKSLGIKPMTFKEAYNFTRAYFNYKNIAEG
ncbi:MAG: D-alanine--D-alanine ligase [Saprospiraceae bacterium]